MTLLRLLPAKNAPTDWSSRFAHTLTVARGMLTMASSEERLVAMAIQIPDAT